MDPELAAPDDPSMEGMPAEPDYCAEPTESYTETKADEKRRQKFDRSFQRMKSVHDVYERKWDKNHRYFRSWRGAPKFTNEDELWRSDMFVAKTYPIVESYRARMNSRLSEPFCQPNVPDTAMQAHKKELVLKYVLNACDAAKSFADAKAQGLIYGTGCVGTFYDDETKTIREPVVSDPVMSDPVLDPVTGEVLEPPQVLQEGEVLRNPDGSIMTKDTEVPVRSEQIIVRWLDVYNVFIDPAATDIDEAEDCAIRYLVTAEEARRKFWTTENGGRGLGRFIRKGMGNTDDPSANRLLITQELASDIRNRKQIIVPDGGVSARNQVLTRFDTDVVELVYYWNKKKDVFQVWCGNLCLVDAPNPYDHKDLPVSIWRDNKIPGELYGVSEPDLLEGFQNMLNDIRNATLDQVRLGIFGTLMVEPGAGVDINKIKIGPGFTNAVKDAKRMEWLKPPPVGPEAGMMEDRVNRDAELMTGLSDVNAGAVQNQQDTATGASIQVQSMEERLNEKVRNFEQEMFTRVLRQISSLCAQFWPEKKLIAVTGDEGSVTEEVITLEDLTADVKITCKPGSGLAPNKLAMRQQLLTLYQQLSGSPSVVQDELVRLLLVAFDVADTDNLVAAVRTYNMLLKADEENKKMRTGQDMPVKEVYATDHELHLSRHLPITQEPWFLELPEGDPVKVAYLMHIAGHEQALPTAPSSPTIEEKEKPRVSVSLSGDDISPEKKEELLNEGNEDDRNPQRFDTSAVPDPTNVTPAAPTEIPVAA